MIRSDGSVVHHGDRLAVFPWWSFTKTLLAICALRRVERGTLVLDTPLQGYRFTLRQVLGHRAGLGCYGQVPAYHAAVRAGGAAWTGTRMVDAAQELRPNGVPGGGFFYSNVGFYAVAQALGARLADVIAADVARPLGLPSLHVAQSVGDMTAQYWPDGRGYDPGWVLHGLAMGTAQDAALVLHALFKGWLLGPGMMAELTRDIPIGGALPGRMWDTHGYGLGLMIGRVDGVGRVMGHGGVGPFSVNACYHFPDLAQPCTVACFGPCDEPAVERAALALAQGEQQ